MVPENQFLFIDQNYEYLIDENFGESIK